MRNRAKCTNCDNIIESLHFTHYVTCYCGDISLWGGKSMHCSARDWSNFLRVDDEGNEIIVKVQEKQETSPELHSKPNKKELLFTLDEMIKNYEKLPQHAMTLPINHYDFASLLLLLSSILNVED